ncbi:DUF6225 family protein [Streptomyces sp. NPDC090052]|uniref:DUF6225 family protein n=1 Tax=Streptomyces sp. NPDC090052 TaxID=3365931 RepID=UPI003828EB51
MSNRRINPEGYHHTVEALTVGRLKEAIAGLPDDTVVAASIPLSLAPRPTDPDGGEDYDWVLTEVEEPPSATHEPVILVLDRPTGRYTYIHREDEQEELAN